MRYRNLPSTLQALTLISGAACLLSALVLTWSALFVFGLPACCGLGSVFAGTVGILTGLAGVLRSTWVLASVTAARLASRHRPSHRAQPWERAWLERHGSPLVRRAAAGGLVLGASLGGAPLAHAVSDDIAVQPAASSVKPATDPPAHPNLDVDSLGPDTGTGSQPGTGTVPDDLSVGTGSDTDGNASAPGSVIQDPTTVVQPDSDSQTDAGTASHPGHQSGPAAGTPDDSRSPSESTPPVAHVDLAPGSPRHLAAASAPAAALHTASGQGALAQKSGQPRSSAPGRDALASALHRLYGAGSSSPARSRGRSGARLPHPVQAHDTGSPLAQPTQVAPPGTVRVEVGDCLWSITATQLRVSGKATPTDAQIAASWPQLYHANREVIGDNPSLIYPGTTLTLPASLTPGEHQ